MRVAEALGLCTTHGWLTVEEAELLVEYAEGPIVEVGSYQGRSACLLALMGFDVHCIDPWPDEAVYLKFVANVRELGLRNVTWERVLVEDAATVQAETAYLDGDHTFNGTLDQITYAQKCGASIIAVHDVNDSGEGLAVKEAAVSTFGAWSDRVGRLAVWKW